MHDALTKNRAQVRDLLCQARHLRGWSQARAAAALGVSKAQYTKIEQRGSVPKWLLVRFSLVLGISVERMLHTRPAKIVPFPAAAPRKKRPDTGP
jgi:transcriptional regulator with XRE-family HTH domain